MNTNALIMENEFAKDFEIAKLEDLTNFHFEEFIMVENDELLLRLAGLLPVNIEKEFVPRYVFDIVLKSDNLKVGFLLLRAALTEKMLRRGGHIGYGIEEIYRGHSYAAKAINLLKPFMKKTIVGKILITCDEDNLASRGTIKRIGGKLIKIEKNVDVPEENCKKDCCYYELI